MTMRDCPRGEIRDLLPLFARGRLAAAEHREVAAHLASCADCAAELALLDATSRAFALPVVDAAPIVSAVLEGRRPQGVAFHRRPLWRVAAAITVMITGAATMLVVQQRAGERGSIAAVSTVTGGAEDSAALQGTIATATDPVGPIDGGSVRAPVRSAVADLTDAQLEALLASLDALEANVLPDPELMAAAIVTNGTDLQGRRNQ